MIARMDDWRSRLIAYLAGIKAEPFAPGRHDCALFVAGAVEAMTGIDFADTWRGEYQTMAGGRRLLRQAGYRNPVEFLGAHFEPVAPAFARPGDIGVVRAAGGLALGIVQGPAIYVVMETGFGVVPLTSAVQAFRVG